MAIRTIKGQTTVNSNTKEDIWQATKFLITEMGPKNKIQRENLCSIIFSCTKDLTATYPSEGAATLSIFAKNPVPMLDVQQMKIEGGLPMCIRIFLNVNIDKDFKEIIHLRRAAGSP